MSFGTLPTGFSIDSDGDISVPAGIWTITFFGEIKYENRQNDVPTTGFAFNLNQADTIIGRSSLHGQLDNGINHDVSGASTMSNSSATTIALSVFYRGGSGGAFGVGIATRVEIIGQPTS